MGTARSGHTATLLGGSQVLVVGGFGGRSQATAERYDPPTNGSTTAGTLVTTRWLHVTTLLPGSLLLVIGGLSCRVGVMESTQRDGTGAWRTSPWSWAGTFEPMAGAVERVARPARRRAYGHGRKS